MKVLLALDESDVSMAALKTIAPWAKASGTEVVLLTVCQPGTIHETVKAGPPHTMTPQGTPSGQTLPFREVRPTNAEDRTQALERARIGIEQRLQGNANEYLAGVHTSVQVAWSNDVPKAIAHYANELKVDLIAMGTHGRKGVAHVLLGSVAEAVLRAAEVPVLLVREGMRIPAGT